MALRHLAGGILHQYASAPIVRSAQPTLLLFITYLSLVSVTQCRGTCIIHSGQSFLNCVMHLLGRGQLD
jgi:hypothetical protein